MRNFILIIFFFFIGIAVNGQNLKENSKLSRLKEKLESEIQASKGTFAVAFKEINNDANQLLINGDEVFHAASTMKTAVMVEVFKQAILGKVSLDDSLLVRNEFKSIVDGSVFSLDVKADGDDQIYSLIGKKRRIYDLVYDMITVSSNLATNLLIDLVSPANVTKTMEEYDLHGIKVLRGVEDIKAYELGLNNTVTATDLMKLYELISTNKILTDRSCEEMIKILLDQKFNEKIPKYLPDNVKVAHKTGSISKVEHDSGVIFLPDGRKYVLVVLSKDLDNNEKGIETIARISKLIYDYMTE
ncbi:MAG: class A beta-lactamase-related serine hydrolase [Ignavibacteria bacterium]|jgi:beta-lactamase class A|nr:class A beta-lactamase-related serine hydrolase [Ignavibacteria bacterium]